MIQKKYLLILILLIVSINFSLALGEPPDTPDEPNDTGTPPPPDNGSAPPPPNDNGDDNSGNGNGGNGGSSGCQENQTLTCSTGLYGICSAGKKICINNLWTNCTSNLQPTTEICSDYLDNNCDGSIDENCAQPPSGNGEDIINDQGVYIPIVEKRFSWTTVIVTSIIALLALIALIFFLTLYKKKKTSNLSSPKNQPRTQPPR